MYPSVEVSFIIAIRLVYTAHRSPLASAPQVLDVEDVERTLGHELLCLFPLHLLLERDHWQEAVARRRHRGELGVIFSDALSAVHLQLSLIHI